MKKMLALATAAFVFLQGGCAAAGADDYSANTGTIDLTAQTVTGEGISVADGVITITKGGDFTVTGENDDCMIYVNADDKVKLRLSGVNLKNADGPAIFFEQSEKSLITITKDTENYVEDGEEYSVDAKAAIFSNDDLEIKGSGSLTVVGNYKHGIASDDDIKIENGTINITAVKDAIHANDDFTMTGGEIELSAGKQGIQAEKAVLIEDGKITVTKSYEGIESGSMLTINGGVIDITASDDGFNSGGGSGSGDSFGFGGGGFGGQIPGGEGQAPDENGQMPGGRMQHGIKDVPRGMQHDGMQPDNNGQFKERPEDMNGERIQNGEKRQNNMPDEQNTDNEENQKEQEQTDCTLTINGGIITVNAGGDGVDSNGDIIMTGGELYVNGPTNNGNGAIDGNSFKVSGGVVFAVGSSGMAMGLSEGSTQRGILYRFSKSYDGGNEVTIKDEDGNVLFAYTPQKSFSSVCFSSDKLEEGKTYSIYVGDENAASASPSYSSGFGSFGGRRIGAGFETGENGRGMKGEGRQRTDVSVKVNGNNINFTQAQPEIKNSTTLVPIRAVLEELGLNVSWNADTKTVTASKNDTEIVLTIGSLKAYKNGEEVTLGAAPEIKNSSTMLPIRFLSEALNLSVKWDEASRLVTIE